MTLRWQCRQCPVVLSAEFRPWNFESESDSFRRLELAPGHHYYMMSLALTAVTVRLSNINIRFLGAVLNTEPQLALGRLVGDKTELILSRQL